MDNNALKDWLFELLNGHDYLFSDVSLYDEADTLFIKSTDGQWFSITVNAMTENQALLNLWGKEHPELMSIALTVRMLRDLDILTKDEYEEYISSVVEHSDTSGIYNVKDMLERLGNKK